MKKLINKLKIASFAVIGIFLLSLMYVTANAATLSSTKAKVVSVTDGDTISVKINNKQEKIRLIGVDTPELKDNFGKEAKNYTIKKLSGKTVYLTYDLGSKDTYGRSLAYVWLSKPKNDTEGEIRSKMFNADLLLKGYGQVMTVQPNSKYSKYFAKFQEEARKGKKGLWKDSNSAKNKPKERISDNATVYYTQSGKSYHKSRTCSTLKRSKDIKNGKLKDVKKKGKTDPCNVCVK